MVEPEGVDLELRGVGAEDARGHTAPMHDPILPRISALMLVLLSAAAGCSTAAEQEAAASGGSLGGDSGAAAGGGGRTNSMGGSGHGPVDDERLQVHLPEELPADCSEDVTRGLQAVLDGLQPGSTLLFPEEGCFLTQRMLVLADREDIRIEGRGSVLRRTELSPVELRYPKHNGHFRFERVRQLHVKGLFVQGTNIGDDYGGEAQDQRGDVRPIQCVGPEFGCYAVTFEFEHGFSFLDCSDVLLEASGADAIWGDGVYVSRSQDIAIVNVEVDRNGRQGMAIVAGERILIDGARILHSRRGGIDLEPDKAADRIIGVEVRNSRLSSWLLAFPAKGASEVSDVFIHHNTIVATGTPWVASYGKAELPRSRWRITDNVVESTLNSPLSGLLFEHTSDVEIARNVVPFASKRDMSAVGLSGASSAVITCNHFPGALQVSSADAPAEATEANNSTGPTPPACLTVP